MSLRSRTQWISPRAWFPYHDPVARAVARLCILREDLYIEWLAMAANEIQIKLPYSEGEEPSDPPAIDDNGIEYRRIYFLRSTLHTLSEVHNAVSGLRANRSFRKMFREFDEQQFNRFTSYVQGLDRNHHELRRIRNALGGHVSRESIERALETMNPGETGKCESGLKMKDTHYGFAATLCAQILMQDVPRDRKHKHLLGIVELNNETIDIISAILTAYLRHHKLFGVR